MADQPESSPVAPAAPSAQQNPAVARCAQAWSRTYELASLCPKKQRDKEEYDSFATEQARAAFRNAMPPLSGRQNIQDFIACTSYAVLHSIFYRDDCTALLECAKIALAAIRAEPRSRS